MRRSCRGRDRPPGSATAGTARPDAQSRRRCRHPRTATAHLRAGRRTPFRAGSADSRGSAPSAPIACHSRRHAGRRGHRVRAVASNGVRRLGSRLKIQSERTLGESVMRGITLAAIALLSLFSLGPTAQGGCRDLPECMRELHELARASGSMPGMGAKQTALKERILGHEDAVDDLVPLLKDPDERVADLAAYVLRDASAIDPRYLP